ncbi:Hypothetical protein GLP15_1023 [Giardia lamblia P15]|uniref:Uncharacterized protein n=1 Tax=Giardia intestinalis (strain P15) TaxID=658858 RepID=E1F311_GIAIA|nr:Hypothetical protein GLP15_1023 [Giardia lamblia P15]
MFAGSIKVKQVTPVSKDDSDVSNIEWLTSLLAHVNTGTPEKIFKTGGLNSSRDNLSDSIHSQIVESLLLNKRLQELCISPLSIASLLRHTSFISLLGQDISNQFGFSLNIPADTLPAVAEIAALLEVCDEEIHSTLLHPVHGYVVLLRQRHAVQHKLESLASYAQACCCIADAIPYLISSRLDMILNHIEQKYFQQYSL